MASSRRRTWDLTHLSTKYPWLRIDAETIEEFRSPFQWVRDGEEDDHDDAASSEGSTEEEEARQSHTKYSLAGQNKKTDKPKRKRPWPAPKRRVSETHIKRVTATLSSPPRQTRSETEEQELPPIAGPSPPVVLPASVYSDFQALKQQQRDRRKEQKKPKPKHHSILSLRFPDLHKPVVSSVPSLQAQRDRLQEQERALQQRLHQQLDAEKAKLPLTFLFERNVDKTYCKQKSMATITSIFAKLQHRLLYYGFQQWLALCEAQRAVERRDAAIKKAQTTAIALFERLASDAYVGTIARGFARWRDTTKYLVHAELSAAAIKIQGLFRQRRARSLLLDLKQGSLDREYKRAVEIDRLLAFERYGTSMKWQTLAHGFNLLRLAVSAKRLTFFFRRIRTNKRIARRVQRKNAAITIQCCWRQKLARLKLQRLVRAREIQRERERVASIHMQRQARGYLARQHAALRRLQVAKETVSVMLIQKAWRRYGDRQRLQRRFQARRVLLDEAQARRDELARIEAARRDDARRNGMAVHIQRIVRGFRGRCAAKRQRKARDLENAVRRVQQSWRKSKGRYALHVRFLAQRERLQERRMASALKLQCRFRMRIAKRQRDELLLERQRRRQSAIAIQRVARGRQTRLELATQRRATVSIQSAWRGRVGRVAAERRRQEIAWEAQQQYAATLKLQCVARGYKARRITRQLRNEQAQLAQLLQQSALLIQKRTRGIEARKVAMLLRDAIAVVDRQQLRAYAWSTQHNVTQSPLLAFVTRQSLVHDDDGSYAPEQLQLIRWEIDAARQHMAREDRAIVLLQRRYRGYVTRMQFAVLQVQRREHLALELRMARKLQRVGRGFLARSRVHKLRAKRKGDQLKEAYVRERRWKEQERAWQEQYREEQLALQLQRLQTLEATRRDAKREAEIAQYQAAAAKARKQELEAQLEAARLEEELRGETEVLGDWAYVADAYGNGYYYNATTGESSWEKPTVAKPPKEKKTEQPKKPDVKEKPSEEKKEPPAEITETVKSPPAEKAPPPVPDTVPDGFCVKCRLVAADKECLDCLLANLELDAVYCNACFTLEHTLLAAADGAKGHHDFKVLRPVHKPSVCQHDGCKTPASYYCHACPSAARFLCEACFPINHDTAQTGAHIPSALHFRAGARVCIECQAVLALRSCTQCDEAFCAACFETLHTQSKKDHEFVPLEIMKDDLASATDAYCVDCEIRKCSKLCNLCGDGFCDACFTAAHAKGHKTEHTSIPWASFATHGDWLEIQDETTHQTVYFNIETKESTHTQPFVLKSGDERHRVLFQEREALMKKKALELEAEIVKLREEMANIAQAKDQEIERLKRRRRGGDGEDDTASPVTFKPTKKGMFGRLFGGNKETKKPLVRDKTLTPEEQKRLALQQQVEADLPLISEKLTTRERAAQEAKAKNTIGTKHFERAMLDEFVKTK